MLAVSRFLAASAKCAIVLSFVAEGRSSYWSLPQGSACGLAATFLHFVV